MKFKKTFIYLNLILLINIFFINALYAYDGAKDIVKERMDKFKTSKTLMQKINKGIQNQDFNVIENSADQLLIWSKEMIKYFPEGSDGMPSEASINIWKDPDGFKTAINNFQNASLNLITKSQTKNMEQTVNAFRDLAETCKGCHKKYRN